MKPFPILMDIDGVVLDWTTGFDRWMASQGMVKQPGPQLNWDLSDAYPGITGRTEIYVNRFAHSPEYADLEFISGARTGLRILRQVFPDSFTVALSCCGVSQFVVRARTRALESVDITGFIPLRITQSKRDHYRCFAPGVVVDDSPKNIVDALEAGHVALMFDHPWNANFTAAYPKFRRVRGWSDFNNQTFAFIRGALNV